MRPWIWDHPVRFISRRSLLWLIDHAVPGVLADQWNIAFGPDLRLVSPLEDMHGRALFLHGYTHYAVAMLMKSVVRPDWLCVDVGANQGEFALLMARLAWGGSVIAFEPVREIYQRFASNVKLNKLQNITLMDSVVHSYDGSCSFFVNFSRINCGLSSLTAQQQGDEGRLEQRQVPCTTLDTALGHLSRVDLIMLDVEGHEGDALRGASGIISRHHPLIIFEFGTLYGLGNSETLDLLRRHGYTIHAILYDAAGGPTLPEMPEISIDTASRYYTYYEPINLAAIPPDRRDDLASILSCP
jgi:FkbM family methyltransferase